ncbi:MAG TPA: alpha-2-macroglobulin family protein [Aridibacter sp.]|nr:alpha-2-macroglobulin family protein [Aridibacter sp.]
MRIRVTTLLAMAVVCLSTAYGQAIDEDGSRATFGEDGLTITFAANSETGGFETRLTVELIDANGVVRSRSSEFVRVSKGLAEYSATLPVGNASESAREDLVWYRVRYRFGAAHGIVSLSQLLTDFFEVSVAATTIIRPGQKFSARISTNEPFAKRPVEGVEIKAVLRLVLDADEEEDELRIERSAVTDKNGYVNLEFEIPAGVVIDWVDDFKVTASKDGYVREVEADMESFGNGETVFLTADKPIYQPGQSFRVRALLFDVNRSVISGGAIEFKIYDEERTLLFSEEVETSEFGIASVSWTIPENAKLGDYRLEAETESDEPSGGELRFKVTRYDLPNFTVSAKPDKAFYVPSDSEASIEISADYLFGKPVANGTAKVVLEKDRKWNWREQKYDIDAAQTVEGPVGPDGKFTAKIDLQEELKELEDRTWRRFEDLTLAAYFTDRTTNRTEQKRFDIRVTKEPIHAYLMIRGYQNNPELPVSGFVSAFYADGSPAQCEFRIEGRSNRDENGAYSVLFEGRTNGYGGARTSFRRPDFKDPEEDLEIRLTATDGLGAVGTLEDEIYFSDSPGLEVFAKQPVLAPGEPIRLSILSTERSARVYVDVVNGWSVESSRDVPLKDGRAEIEIPYSDAFRGETDIWAYFEYVDDDNLRIAKSAVRVIYPEQRNLLLDTRFSAASYKPGEEASVGFNVSNGNGTPEKSALGVVVFDKAVEERARTDAEFGSYFGGFSDWLGLSRGFSGFTLKDLNELDPLKPLPDDLLIAAELVLAYGSGNYWPEIDRSEIDLRRPSEIFKAYFETQFRPITEALKKNAESGKELPNDVASLSSILSGYGLSLNALVDPWGQSYRPVFNVKRSRIVLSFETAGADKKFDTKDDLTVGRPVEFEYFRSTGQAISDAVRSMREHTGIFIRDYATLRDVLRGKGIELDELRDPWGNKYKYEFEIQGRNYVTRVRSAGPDGKFERSWFVYDDFKLWEASADYLAETEARINAILSNEANKDAWKFPETEEEFWNMLERGGLPRDEVVDGWGRLAYAKVWKSSRYADTYENVNGKLTLKPVTEELVTAELRSKGEDGKADDEAVRGDDFRLGEFTNVLSQRLRSMTKAEANVRTTTYSGSNGAIRGTVTDATGAVIPGATATATNRNTGLVRTVTSGEAGVFLIPNLPTGIYDLRVSSSGFKDLLYSNIRVSSFSLSQIEVTLEVGDISVEVSVIAQRVESIDTSDASVATSTTVERTAIPGTGVQMQTPRLREYFPETLVWAPEVITDEQGKAELKFRMADNITTWKMYTVASTKNGKIGVSENEVTAFQPFFADLEPPKFLTTGDEIHLPVQIRNYTPDAQPVNVTMDRADWFSFLGESEQKIDVPSNTSENAVFGFRAERAVEGGKQRVTAIATGDSDAIEKPVTVRPNGQEITSSETKLFSETSSFRADFPVNAIDEGRSTRLRIYPNLLANVADSADGLLKRPYGCGEQTISSTYPNLMILKLAPENSGLRRKANEFLRKGYERLLGYQVSSGGFTYWGRENSEDLALTAYALRFLKDASGKIDVDGSVIRKAEKWLLSQQKSDGSWTVKYRWENSEDRRRTRMTTSYIARSLAMGRVESKTPTGLDRSLALALAYLRTRNAEIDEPYALALYGLASLEAGFREEAESAAAALRKMAIAEGSAAYWKLETNTPFYGWGTAGRIETTALVVQLLAKLSNTGEERGTVQKGTMFLLNNKDRYGVWYSTQTTINVLDAILATLERSNGEGERSASISVNGNAVRTLPLPPSNELAPVIDVDLTAELGPAQNAIEVKVSDDSNVMAHVVRTHYIDWGRALAGRSANEAGASNTTVSRLLEMDYSCDRLEAKVMEEVTCSLRAERVGFRGYGMLLAELGIPPGADVNRESLARAMSVNWSVSRYDVLPDRVIVYMWAQPGGTKFDFTFRPRYGINAQTPPSVVYDYYNDEARAVVAPLRFSVE